MTLFVGKDKVVKVLVGGNTMVNMTDVWQLCENDSRFAGTPILMHYNEKSGVTSFLGEVQGQWNYSEGSWSTNLLTLPVGFHFTKVDPKITIFAEGIQANESPTAMEIVCNGRKLLVDFKKWPWATNIVAGDIRMVFGDLGYTGNIPPKVWQTTTVVPD